MKKFLILLALTFPLRAQVSTPDREYVNRTLIPATAILFSQEVDGGMKMRCTATAIEKNETGYVFVSAAHCACEDDTAKKTVSPEKTHFYLTADDIVSKDFLRATPVGCGYKHRGDDFALFQVDTKVDFPVVPLGDDPKVLDAVVNVASPLGLGKQVFFGTVASPAVQRPLVEGDINWEGATLLQIFGVNGGSSGSSVICLDQHKICGFIVGAIDGTAIVAMPVSRLVKFRQALNENRYMWWRPDPDKGIGEFTFNGKK